MAEEHGKGVALVILGIVAIIAIVGLVLLFTGARKAATGDVTFPQAKTYGGSITTDANTQHARNFAGSASDFGAREVGSAGTTGNCYGDSCGPEQIIKDTHATYNRAPCSVPAMQTTCTGISLASGLYDASGNALLPVPASAGQVLSYGGTRQCIAVKDLMSLACQVETGNYGMTFNEQDAYKSIGADSCCASPSSS